MSHNGLNEPLAPATARNLLRSTLVAGSVSFSTHASEEMRTDKITEDEALAVLRGGVVESGEVVRGSWRYRVRSSRIVVVVTFRNAEQVAVVTAWRLRR